MLNSYLLLQHRLLEEHRIMDNTLFLLIIFRAIEAFVPAIYHLFISGGEFAPQLHLVIM
jgi:hypothetical protein